MRLKHRFPSQDKVSFSNLELCNLDSESSYDFHLQIRDQLNSLTSLDLCNRYLAGGYGGRLADTAARMEALRGTLRAAGWQAERSDPLRLTLRAPAGITGMELAQRLRQGGVECEFADPEFLVLMATPENSLKEFSRVAAVLGENRAPAETAPPLPLARGERVMSIRQALFAPHRRIPAGESLGKICGAPTVACPPAIPIAVSGERIGPEAVVLFAHYGVQEVDVLI